VSAYVLDASVVVKWFLPEPWAEAARRLRRADLDCHSPDLLLLETCNALWKHVVKGNLEISVAREAVESPRVAELCGEARISPSKSSQEGLSERRHDQRVELRADFAPLFRLFEPRQSDFELRGASRAPFRRRNGWNLISAGSASPPALPPAGSGQ